MAEPQVAHRERIMTIKGSLNTIQFQERYREALEQFVRIVNDTIRHAHSLLKFIFLREFRNPQFDPLQYHFNKAFLQEYQEHVWESIKLRCELAFEDAGSLEDVKTLRPQAALHESKAGVHITNQQLKTRTYQEITEPAKWFRKALSRSSDTEIFSATFALEGGIHLRTLGHLRLFICYDVKASPERHFKAFFHLEKILEDIAA
ncbi:hypothetical protein [Parasitella parasitica]|uniref:Uncharacterized protein n=1 Tax=Parasitella parasitica TaxID=35722 RepID=A0A0B7MSL0_9FUNG|nr:hypothetical protein [Parasitella parasitica]